MRFRILRHIFLLSFALLLYSCNKKYSLQEYISDTPAKQFENYTFDKSLKIHERINSSDEMVLEYLRDMDQNPDYTFYEISHEEKLLFSDYINQLPPLYQEILDKRLIAVYFVNDLFGSGLADFVLSENEDLYTILLLNPMVFEQTISQLVTFKDKSCFRQDEINLKLDIEISDDYSGLMYILMHESTHIVDYIMNKTPYVHPSMKEIRSDGYDASDFVRQFWKNYEVPEDFVLFDYRKQLNFYSEDNNEKISNREMINFYQELRDSPFTSLYSSVNWAEDYAEYATFYYFTQSLNLDYRITIRENNTPIFVYEPFSNRMVLDRAQLLEYKFD